MNDFQATQPPTRGGLKFKHILLLALVAFVGGCAAFWWVASEYRLFGFGASAPVVARGTEPAAPATTAFTLPPADSVAGIENRLTQINVDAAAASGNAARAEGLLVAFAARRAIDSGAPLGYISDQIRLRFGSTQPQAVAVVLSAAQAPVTLDMLKAELTGLESSLLTGNREAGVWATVSREFSELFVLRKDGAPSPAPTQRMARAHAMVESGNVGGAIAEISAMPGASVARSWLERANRYLQARKALDTLERTALLAAPPAPISAPPPPAGDKQAVAVPE